MQLDQFLEIEELLHVAVVDFDLHIRDAGPVQRNDNGGPTAEWEAGSVPAKEVPEGSADDGLGKCDSLLDSPVTPNKGLSPLHTACF